MLKVTNVNREVSLQLEHSLMPGTDLMTPNNVELQWFYLTLTDTYKVVFV